jgi:Mg2+-importing ATPase
MAIIPRIPIFGKRGPQTFAVSPLLIEAAKSDVADVLTKIQSSKEGLSEEEAEKRLAERGPNIVAAEKQATWPQILIKAILNPLVLLLLILATITFVTAEETSDYVSGIIMVAMVVLGISLRFVQELRADNAAAKLKAMITVTATVVRGGQAREIPLAQLVQGDVVRLSAGDMIPADLRILACKDLFVIQSSLTGESLPVEKVEPKDTRPDRMPLEHNNICFLGSSVERGSANAVAVATGQSTYLGGMAKAITGAQVQTAFDRGINRFTWMMLTFMLVMTPLVFLINGLFKLTPDGLHHDWKGASLFALAVAVGLTPEMLPMIISVCLSKGAILMSKKKVIVKRLNSIQNFGAMDVLCTDKTGTLTMDKVILERYCDVAGKEDDGVLEFAFLNSHFQTGLKNLLDRAVLEHKNLREELAIQKYSKFDEIPFDFQRKMMSVVVETPEKKHRLICKGATEEVYKRCTQFALGEKIHPIDPVLINDLRDEYQDLSADGFRVLAIAYRDFDPKAAYSTQDENELILQGYIAFLDPPKETAAPAIKALQSHGIAIKVLTGDNDLVTKKICREVGLPVDTILVGSKVEAMSDAELADAAEKTSVFARLSPAHKQRIIQALQSKHHVVGFLGDGINDAPALRAADVGISVDTAVDIAKESADMILLEKSLMVLEEGVIEGRKVFANILKYVRMGASSNFGNMFSVLGASILLPFLPMTSLQILMNNLLYDFSQVPIPTDEVDPEQIAKPAPWSMGLIARFILFIGPCSSIFDYTTYFLMLYVFGCWYVPAANPTQAQEAMYLYKSQLFQTGWFVESLLTQTLIIHVIRTNKIPFIQSRASWPLIMTTVAIMAVGSLLPYSPLAKYLGFQPLDWLYWPFVLLTLLCYTVLTQLIKMWLVRKKMI